MTRLRRVGQRLANELKNSGFRATVATAHRYFVWKLQGSPARVFPNPPSLSDWHEAYDHLEPESVGLASFSVICPAYGTPPELLRQCVQSVLAQTYERWEMVIVDDASPDEETREALDKLVTLDRRLKLVRLSENLGIAGATNAGVEAATGEYLVFLDHDDLLAPTALAWLSTCTPDADLIYSDEDKVYEDGTYGEAFFKPAWSPRLLFGFNYVNHLTCVRTVLFRELGGLDRRRDGVQDHDFLLRLSEREGLIVHHIPNILYRWRSWSGSVASDPHSKQSYEAAGLEMIADAIVRRGWHAHAGLGNGAPFNYRVYFDPEPEPPLVKIVMPTRDGFGLLRQAVDGVLNRTDGVRIHLVIVDNGSREPSAVALLKELSTSHDDVTVHTIDDAFNFSRLCNEGVTMGPDAPLVLFLDNDIEIRHRRWLLQLTGWIRDPGIGAVGPKLLYPDGTIQHAGVVLGMGGIAGHYASGLPNEPQLSNLHDQAREVACLTGACLLMRTTDYTAVGGMDELLAVEFQDVDLCLRVKDELRLTLMYDPTYPLTHHESTTCGPCGKASQYARSRLRFRWGELRGADCFFSPHISLESHDFALGVIPGDVAKRQERLSSRCGGREW